jgi:hypothetical protein
MQDFKDVPTVNGVRVSLQGHTHSVSEITDTYATRVRRATTVQSISANTATKIQFNVEDYDYGNNYDNVTNFRWTTPAAQTVGIYRVMCSIYLSGTSIGRLMLYKNGVEYQRLVEYSSAIIQYTGSTEIGGLVAGTDYLEIYAYLSTARSVAITNSFLSISSVF